MQNSYLIVHKSILPDYYEKVLTARRLMDSGKVREVSQAVKQAGISRSTYYKYKDFIFEPADMDSGHKAVLSMMLDHEPGILSSLLLRISDAGASVLTIDQSLPIHGKASLTMALDLSGMQIPLATLQQRMSDTQGVELVRLLAVE